MKREHNHSMVAGVFLRTNRVLPADVPAWRGVPWDGMRGQLDVPEAGDDPGAWTTLAAWTFGYDGDGTRVKQVYTDAGGTVTTYYFPLSSSGLRFGGADEVRVEGAVTTTLKYYSLGGQTVKRDDDGLKYLLTDHPGSVVAITDEDGGLIQETRYLPFDGVRDDVGMIPFGYDVNETDLAYTGQKAQNPLQPHLVLANP